eukprot:jgi/Mesen1/9758/ME000007S09817
MDELVRNATFCQVKQIYSPFSPHLFAGQFPARASGDCEGKYSQEYDKTCAGDPDQFGSYRDPRIISLKHHWWWMMNTVWDGLPETRGFRGHVMFVEEDHFLFPNALRTAQRLVALKRTLCPECVAVHLAPMFDGHREMRWNALVVERMSNIGYTFNRSVWEHLREASEVRRPASQPPLPPPYAFALTLQQQHLVKTGC